MIKRLPKSLTIVTPFSKSLALFLFLVLPFAGFYLGTQYQQKITQTKEPDATIDYPTPTNANPCFAPKGSKIDNNLYLLTRSEKECSEQAAANPLIKQAVNRNKVQVYILVSNPSFTLSQQMGSEERRSGNTIQASVYIDKLLNLASDPKIGYVSLPNYGITQLDAKGIISGKSVIGPSCPAMREPPDDQCKDKAYPTTIIVKSQDGTKEITRVPTDINGLFTISLPAGTYQLIGMQKNATEVSYPRAKSTIVTVETGKTATATVSYDSGIR